MFRVKHIIMVFGLLLVLGGGGSAVASDVTEIPPIVIAREAEAVTRVVRIWMKRPVRGTGVTDAPSSAVVAYIPNR